MKKKLTLIITLSLLGVLVTSVIILALVRQNYRPELNDPYKISITDTSNSQSVEFFKDATAEDSKDMYNEVLNKFYASFDQSVLNAIFTGGIGGDKVTNHYVQDTTENGGQNTYKPLIDGIEGYYLEFEWQTEQTLKYNGKDVVDASNTNKKITYKHMACYIEDSNIYKTMHIFFRVEKSDKTGIFYMTTSAKCENFYNYIAENLLA